MVERATKFEIDELEANARSKVIVSFSRTTVNNETGTAAQREPVVVVGFISNELNITASAEHNTPFQSSAQESMTELGNKVQGTLSRFGFEGLSPISLKTFAQTVNNWNGSSRPSFTVDMKFIRLRKTPEDDVRIRAKLLYETVMPATKEFIFAGTMQPPLNYLPVLGSKDDIKSARGTMTVTIGNWFQASNQVMKNVSFSFSKQVVEDGSPLYAMGSITFEPYRMPTLDEFLGYFGTFNPRVI